VGTAAPGPSGPAVPTVGLDPRGAV
jgi:hypothetical protein